MQNALHSLAGDVDAPYDLPGPAELPELNTFDPELEKTDSATLVKEAQRICSLIKGKTNAEVGAYMGASRWRIELLNSKGFHGVNLGTGYGAWMSASYPGGATSVSRRVSGKGFVTAEDALIEELISRYNDGMKDVTPDSGAMQVLFMPGGVLPVMWRLTHGLNGFLVYRGVSPIKDKVGEKIVSDKITLINNPLDDTQTGAETFDDEGVPTRKLTLVENGVLKSFYWDLKYAAKMGVEPTGTGRGGPNAHHYQLAGGEKSMSEIIAGMKRGIILEGCIGAHSGNLVNGDYSVAVGPAYYVEDGQILGRIRDAMVAGNAYETLSNVSELSRERAKGYAGRGEALLPAMLCEDVSVTIKK